MLEEKKDTCTTLFINHAAEKCLTGLTEKSTFMAGLYHSPDGILRHVDFL